MVFIGNYWPLNHCLVQSEIVLMAHQPCPFAVLDSLLGNLLKMGTNRAGLDLLNFIHSMLISVYTRRMNVNDRATVCFFAHRRIKVLEMTGVID